MTARSIALGATLLAGSLLTGCGDDMAKPTTVSLYDKYGGAATVRKVVDDAVTGLLADCTQAPYFTNNLGKPGHISAERLKSCLRLQFTAVLGGPATYPGVNDRGEMCADMTTIHRGIGVTSDVFDRFIMDVGAVLKADGVSDADIAIAAPVLVGLKGQVVDTTPIVYTACPR